MSHVYFSGEISDVFDILAQDPGKTCLRQIMKTTVLRFFFCLLRLQKVLFFSALLIFGVIVWALFDLHGWCVLLFFRVPLTISLLPWLCPSTAGNSPPAHFSIFCNMLFFFPKKVQWTAVFLPSPFQSSLVSSSCSMNSLHIVSYTYCLSCGQMFCPLPFCFTTCSTTSVTFGVCVFLGYLH